MKGLLVAMLWASTAAASAGTQLAAARADLKGFRLAAALEKAQQGLASGTATVDETWALHALVGEVSAAMGYADASVRSFRKALVLHPTYELPMDASPKLLEPFEKARAAVHGRLGARIESGLREAAVTTVVSVEGDSEHLVERARIVPRGGEPVLAAAGAPLTARWSCAQEVCPYFVVLLDAAGNALVSLGTAEAPLEARRVPVPAAGAETARPPPAWYRHPVFYGVVAGLSVGALLYCAVQFSSAQQRLLALDADRSTGTFAQASALDASRHGHYVGLWAAAVMTGLSGAGLVYSLVW